MELKTDKSYMHYKLSTLIQCTLKQISGYAKTESIIYDSMVWVETYIQYFLRYTLNFTHCSKTSSATVAFHSLIVKITIGRQYLEIKGGHHTYFHGNVSSEIVSMQLHFLHRLYLTEHVRNRTSKQVILEKQDLCNEFNTLEWWCQLKSSPFVIFLTKRLKVAHFMREGSSEEIWIRPQLFKLR